MPKNTKTNLIRKLVAVVALSAAALAPAAVVTASPASAAACQWDPWTHHCY